MQIRRIQYARVPKIQMLNHRFRPDAKHLVVTLDVNGYNPPATRDFFSIYRSLADLFPTLSKHSCCEEWENTPLYLQQADGVSIKAVGETADVAHLVEHVMVDMQCAISQMRLCSGITCGHRKPENRFDIFVECTSPRVGAFTARLATFLVDHLLTRPRLSRRYRDLMDAARLIASNQTLENNPVELSRRMGRCPTVGRWALERLTAFRFIESQEAVGD